jgi:hypothetical protein
LVVTPHDTTNPRVFIVHYLAVDKSFPYHFNMFHNIEANYSNGALANINQNTSSQRIYTNTLNYTTLSTAFGFTFKTFNPTFSLQKIALYLSSIWNYGDSD